MSSRTTEFRLLTAAACGAALLPRLAHRGMFLDGVTYASIARNLAEGRGRFWQPFYTATIYPAFHEHPPLAFWIQSFWFRVLGDHLFVERLYCAAAAGATAALIGVTWRALYRDSDARSREWLPIVLWIAVPVVSWTIVGNLLETTVSAFTMASVAALVAGAIRLKPDSTRGAAQRGSIGAGVVSGIAVAGAVLSKGPVGLFPLAAPLMLGLIPDVRGRVVQWVVGQWSTVALCAAGVLLVPAARDSLAQYFDQQVVTALAGSREVSGSSFTILVALVEGVWLPFAILAAMAVALARGWSAPSHRDRRVALAFTLTGLAGTLPILISPKQTGHYLMPAVPFYAIGAAALLSPTIATLTTRMTPLATALVRVVAVLLAIGALVATRVPALDRDAALLDTLDRIAPLAPLGATAGICPEANSRWLLHAWFQRRFRISLDAATPRSHEWFVKTGDGPECPPPSCAAVSNETRDVALMRCH